MNIINAYLTVFISPPMQLFGKYSSMKRPVNTPFLPFHFFSFFSIPDLYQKVLFQTSIRALWHTILHLDSGIPISQKVSYGPWILKGLPEIIFCLSFSLTASYLISPLRYLTPLPANSSCADLHLYDIIFPWLPPFCFGIDWLYINLSPWGSLFIISVNPVPEIRVLVCPCTRLKADWGLFSIN